MNAEPFPRYEKPHQQLIGATWHNASPGDGDVDEYCGNGNNSFEAVYIYDPLTFLLRLVPISEKQFSTQWSINLKLYWNYETPPTSWPLS